MVFRSGRTGDKNLYIMPTEGEEKDLLRLTEGPWDDTMPGWTPASGWIVFASSRNYVESNRPAGAFDIFMVQSSQTRAATLLVPSCDLRWCHVLSEVAVVFPGCCLTQVDAPQEKLAGPSHRKLSCC